MQTGEYIKTVFGVVPVFEFDGKQYISIKDYELGMACIKKGKTTDDIAEQMNSKNCELSNKIEWYKGQIEAYQHMMKMWSE